MTTLTFNQFDILNDTENKRKMLSFEFTSKQFDAFDRITKALPDDTAPEFKHVEKGDVSIAFGDELTLVFQGAAEALPESTPFMLVGGHQDEGSEMQIVVSLIVRKI